MARTAFDEWLAWKVETRQDPCACNRVICDLYGCQTEQRLTDAMCAERGAVYKVAGRKSDR